MEIAKLLYELNQQDIVSIDTLHLMGFSLGAHMMGRVGHILRTEKNLVIPRITGN